MITLARNENQPWSIAVDGTSVDWTDRANPGEVKKLASGGRSGIGQNDPAAFTVDARNVYWANGAGSILKVAN